MTPKDIENVRAKPMSPNILRKIADPKRREARATLLLAAVLAASQGEGDKARVWFKCAEKMGRPTLRERITGLFRRKPHAQA